MTEPSKFSLTPQEIAAMLAVKVDTVLDWIHRGELAAINVARRLSTRPRYRVKATEFEAFLKTRAARVAVPSPHRRRSYKGLV
jgi:excisionase family DNA binding protein